MHGELTALADDHDAYLDSLDKRPASDRWREPAPSVSLATPASGERRDPPPEAIPRPPAESSTQRAASSPQ